MEKITEKLKEYLDLMSDEEFKLQWEELKGKYNLDTNTFILDTNKFVCVDKAVKAFKDNCMSKELICDKGANCDKCCHLESFLKDITS